MVRMERETLGAMQDGSRGNRRGVGAGKTTHPRRDPRGCEDRRLPSGGLRGDSRAAQKLGEAGIDLGRALRGRYVLRYSRASDETGIDKINMPAWGVEAEHNGLP